MILTCSRSEIDNLIQTCFMKLTYHKVIASSLKGLDYQQWLAMKANGTSFFEAEFPIIGYLKKMNVIVFMASLQAFRFIKTGIACNNGMPEWMELGLKLINGWSDISSPFLHSTFTILAQSSWCSKQIYIWRHFIWKPFL